MRKLLRPILGISIVALAVPVVAIAMSGSPEIPEGPPPSSAALEASESTSGQSTQNLAPEGISDPSSPPDTRQAESSTETLSDPKEESTSTSVSTSPSTSTSEPGSQTSTTTSPVSKEIPTVESKIGPALTAPPKLILRTSPTTTVHKNTNQPAPTTPTTVVSSSPTTTAAPASVVVQGEITGTACPCTVTGAVQLKGTVNLTGDIMVNGGTLVVRPGVTVNGNGYQIMFMNGGKADFQGSKVFTWSGNGSNANLVRDINFNNMRRIMFHQGAGKSTLKYFAVRDSGTAGVVGDYPIHWHLNGNSTRGTLVEGVVVVNGAFHAFVPHGSHGITFRDTIAKNIAGAAYWWDPPGTNSACVKGEGCGSIDNSNDTLYDHVLVDGARPEPGSRGTRASGFVLGAGSGNIVRNSGAINTTGKSDCSGFHWPEFTAGSGRNQPLVWTFTNNFARSSSCHGTFVWQNDAQHHLIDGFTGDGISHGAYSNAYEYRNVNVPYFRIHAAGVVVGNGTIQTVEALKHRNDKQPTATFTGGNISRFVINNAGDSGDIPGMYVFNNTGLSCGNVEYGQVVPGTRVVINGSDC